MRLRLAASLLLLCACAAPGTGQDRPEPPKKTRLEWSVFHPLLPDPDLIRKYVALADEHGIEGFEIAADAYGMDKALLFEAFPKAAAQIDRAAVMDLRRRLNECVKIAHKAGKRVVYWHREVVAPKGLMEDRPDLLDADGEIDFKGEAYWEYLRGKIRSFLEAVPAIDGLVLTLTEAQYAVINNSNPAKNPPEQVAARMIRTFAGELAPRRKSFTFRTFGSIRRDYDILTKAADLASADCDFEVETKIVPFDWSLVLPLNPYLRRPARGTLAAELDLIGEYMGMGEIPCLTPDLVVQQVRHAQRTGCDRLVARIDRWGRTFPESVNRINIYAFSRAARDPAATAEQIWQEWAAKEWGDAAAELLPIMQSSKEMILKAHYVDGHMLSQMPQPRWDWIMLGGTFSVFQENVSLENARDFWSMLSEKTSPARARLLQEKREAVALADRGTERVRKIEAKIPEKWRGPIVDAWRKARWTTRLQEATTQVIVAYFEDIERGFDAPKALAEAIASSLALADEAVKEFPAGFVLDIAEVVRINAKHFPLHYAAEAAARKEWAALTGLTDRVVCGGIVDEWRVHRYMHASGVLLLDERPARRVANKVFPNGFLDYSLKAPKGAPARLLVRLSREDGPVKVTIGKLVETLRPSPGKGWETITLDLPTSDSDRIAVRFEKTGNNFPVLGGVAVQAR